MDEFQKIDDFEQIIAQAIAQAQEAPESYKLNFSLKVSFPVKMVFSAQLDDASSLATAFQEYDCPPSLYINHGSYITPQGIAHVVKELKEKHTSNRAIISLINQCDIIDSGDSPIPSFMVIQFSVENTEHLYVTAYFRALEVSRFLRVNIEEIRMLCKNIADELKHIATINLNIFAFRAYEKEGINTLEIPEIERMDSVRLLKRLEHTPSQFAGLLREKAKYSTVIDGHDLREIERIVTDVDIQKDFHEILRARAFTQQLGEAIKLTEELRQLRESASHYSQLEELFERYQEALEKLAKEFERCL